MAEIAATAAEMQGLNFSKPLQDGVAQAGQACSGDFLLALLGAMTLQGGVGGPEILQPGTNATEMGSIDNLLPEPCAEAVPGEREPGLEGQALNSAVLLQVLGAAQSGLITMPAAGQGEETGGFIPEQSPENSVAILPVEAGVGPGLTSLTGEKAAAQAIPGVPAVEQTSEYVKAVGQSQLSHFRITPDTVPESGKNTDIAAEVRAAVDPAAPDKAVLISLAEPSPGPGLKGGEAHADGQAAVGQGQVFGEEIPTRTAPAAEVQAGDRAVLERVQDVPTVQARAEVPVKLEKAIQEGGSDSLELVDPAKAATPDSKTAELSGKHAGAAETASNNSGTGPAGAAAASSTVTAFSQESNSGEKLPGDSRKDGNAGNELKLQEPVAIGQAARQQTSGGTGGENWPGSGDQKAGASEMSVPVHEGGGQRHSGPTPLSSITPAKFPAVIVPQVMDSLRGMTRENGRVTVISLKLEPENMGEIKIRLAYSKGELSVHFFTSSGLVKDAVECSLPQLRDTLAQYNVNLGEAAAFVGQERQNHSGANPGGFGYTRNSFSGGFAGGSSSDTPVSASAGDRLGSLDMFI